MGNKKQILEKTEILIYVGSGHDSFNSDTRVASIPPRMIAIIEDLKFLANAQWQLALPFAVE